MSQGIANSEARKRIEASHAARCEDCSRSADFCICAPLEDATLARIIPVRTVNAPDPRPTSVRWFWRVLPGRE